MRPLFRPRRAPRPPRRAARPGLLVATLAGALGLVLGGATPAGAHGEDPTLVPILEAVTPALPAELAVQVRTGVSEQMIVGNPTAVPLLVLDPDGAPFLRVSTRGAFGNVADPFFHRTLNPPGVPVRLPKIARAGAEAQWVKLSPGESWGWFEPRLHPFDPGQEPPATAGSDPVVATWRVGLRLGGRAHSVTGVLQRRAVTGSFRASIDPFPGDVSVVVAQGRVPALLLIAPPQREVMVAGSDGAPFLRLSAKGAFADPRSASFRDNPDFADLDRGPDGWVRVGEPGRVRWLDSRLQYSADRPPEVVERASRVTVLSRWEIPMRVDGGSANLRGEIEWVPLGTAASAPGPGSGSHAVALIVTGGFLAAGVALVAAARRKRAVQVAAAAR